VSSRTSSGASTHAAASMAPGSLPGASSATAAAPPTSASGPAPAEPQHAEVRCSNVVQSRRAMVCRASQGPEQASSAAQFPKKPKLTKAERRALQVGAFHRAAHCSQAHSGDAGFWWEPAGEPAGCQGGSRWPSHGRHRCHLSGLPSQRTQRQQRSRGRSSRGCTRSRRQQRRNGSQESQRQERKTAGWFRPPTHPRTHPHARTGRCLCMWPTAPARSHQRAPACLFVPLQKLGPNVQADDDRKQRQMSKALARQNVGGAPPPSALGRLFPPGRAAGPRTRHGGEESHLLRAPAAVRPFQRPHTEHSVCPRSPGAAARASPSRTRWTHAPCWPPGSPRPAPSTRACCAWVCASPKASSQGPPNAALPSCWP
jgi:hypothetical protein